MGRRNEGEDDQGDRNLDFLGHVFHPPPSYRRLSSSCPAAEKSNMDCLCRSRCLRLRSSLQQPYLPSRWSRSILLGCLLLLVWPSVNCSEGPSMTYGNITVYMEARPPLNTVGPTIIRTRRSPILSLLLSEPRHRKTPNKIGNAIPTDSRPKNLLKRDVGAELDILPLSSLVTGPSFHLVNSSGTIVLSKSPNPSLSSRGLNLGPSLNYPIVNGSRTRNTPPKAKLLIDFLNQPFRTYQLPWKIFIGSDNPICSVTDVYSSGWFHGDHTTEHCMNVLKKYNCVFIALVHHGHTVHFLTDTTSITCVGYRDPTIHPHEWADVFSFVENPRTIVDYQPPLFYRSVNFTVFPTAALSTCMVSNETHIFPQNIFTKLQPDEVTYVPLSRFYQTTGRTLAEAVSAWKIPIAVDDNNAPTPFLGFVNAYTYHPSPIIGFSSNVFSKVCRASTCTTPPSGVPPYYVFDDPQDPLSSFISELPSWDSLYADTDYFAKEQVIEGTSSFVDVLLKPYIEALFGFLGGGIYSLLSKILSFLFETPIRPFVAYLVLSCSVFYKITGNSYLSLILSLFIIFLTKNSLF
nr:VP5-6 [Guaico Culex virus]